MANNPTTGAKYPYAVPFDVIRDFKALQQQVKDMQISTSGPAGPWNNVTTFSGGWTIGGGHFNWRSTGNKGIQIDCYRLSPGTLADGTTVVTGLLTPVTPKEFPVAIDKTPANCARAVLSATGTIFIDGMLGTGATDMSFNVILPLDV
jgi:hypothetical protein